MVLNIIGPRKNVLQKAAVSVVSMLYKLIQRVFEVFEDFQLVGFCSLDYAVENGTGFSALFREDVDPVFAA